MKVKRLIEKYKKLEGVWDAEGAELARQIFLQDLEQLDEPEKVVVPQFVADWIKVAKPVYSLSGAMVYGSPGVNKWLEIWDNQGLFARAWLDGYEVEKEKRYLVKLKGIFKGCEYLNFKFGRVWTFSNEEENEEYRTRHTRKELEAAGFGWVFSCKGGRMSRFAISLSKDDLEHIANGYDIKIKIDGKRFLETNEIILKPAVRSDLMNPLLNYKHKIIDTEVQNIANNFRGGTR